MGIGLRDPAGFAKQLGAVVVHPCKRVCDLAARERIEIGGRRLVGEEPGEAAIALSLSPASMALVIRSPYSST